VLLHDAAEGGGLAGELIEMAADRGMMLSLAGLELRDLLAVRGEPVQQARGRVVAGHHQVQG
jgi:hypothetical protein